MICAASYIDIKQGQDYADSLFKENQVALILCDGIGEFKDSRKVAEIVVNNYLKSSSLSIVEAISYNNILELKENKVEAGTTIIAASSFSNMKEIRIEYLGNGGIIQLHGDYADNPESDIPYRFSNLMLPHVNSKRELNKHLSIKSDKNRWTPTVLTIKPNSISGDIFVFFSDGITTLEEQVILKDDSNRYWRNENDSIQYILSELNKFLLNQSVNSKSLLTFIDRVLNDLKKQKLLEDDASLGVIITKEVLSYYSDIK